MEIYLSSNDDEKVFIESIYHGNFALAYASIELKVYIIQCPVYSFYFLLNRSLVALLHSNPLLCQLVIHKMQHVMYVSYQFIYCIPM